MKRLMEPHTSGCMTVSDEKEKNEVRDKLKCAEAVKKQEKMTPHLN